MSEELEVGNCPIDDVPAELEDCGLPDDVRLEDNAKVAEDVPVLLAELGIVDDDAGVDSCAELEVLVSASDDPAVVDDAGRVDDFGRVEDAGRVDDFGMVEDFGGVEVSGRADVFGGAVDFGGVVDFGGATWGVDFFGGVAFALAPATS